MIKVEKIDEDSAIVGFGDITLKVDRSTIPENAQEGAELNFTMFSQDESIGKVEEITEVVEEDNKTEEIE
jgi:hypothetical protein